MRYVEKKKLPFSSAPHDDRNLPDVHLGLYDDVIVFDHVEKVFFLVIKQELLLFSMCLLKNSVFFIYLLPLFIFIYYFDIGSCHFIVTNFLDGFF